MNLSHIIRKSANNIFYKIILFCFIKFRKLILKIYDPTISYRLDVILNLDNPLVKNEMFFPLSHNLPYILIKHPLYSDNVGVIAKYVFKKYSDLMVIDIGANIGDTIFMVKNHVDVPMLCIEGDSNYYKILEKNKASFKNVFTVNAFVSNNSTSIEGKLNATLGTGQIIYDNSNRLNMKTLDEIFVENKLEYNPKLLKIDTDGFDFKIIRGASNYINNYKPIIFFEYDPHCFLMNQENGLSIFSYLATMGYQIAIFYDNYGKAMSIQNLSDKIALKVAHHYMLNRNGNTYYDICCFNEDDNDVLTNLISSILID